jgi:hypothetical protein
MPLKIQVSEIPLYLQKSCSICYQLCGTTLVPHHQPNFPNKLQVIQNEALHIITGCHKMSPITHLHAETKVLPVGVPLEMLCSQFLANALTASHIS